MRLFFAVILFALSKPCTAGTAVPESCGEFEAWGRISRMKGGYELIVNEGSQSEVRLRIPPPAWLRAASHERGYVRARGKIPHAVVAFRGEFVPTEMAAAVPDPLRGQNAGFRAVTPAQCDQR